VHESRDQIAGVGKGQRRERESAELRQKTDNRVPCR
jgi:hypothetical protein